MVSIVIPLYNAAPYIERCLKSVVEQSYKKVEVVVVDDASTDHSLGIVESFCQTHPNIRIVKHAHNCGLMLTRYDGCKAAKGELIVFVDADDCLPTEAIAQLMAQQQLTRADIVMGNLLKIYVNGKEERRRGCLNADRCATPTEVLAALIDERIIHSLCGKLFKASLFKQGGLHIFNHLTIAEDGCLLYQLVSKATCIASINAYTYCYYENKASASLRAYSSTQIENIIVAYQTIAEVCAPYAQLRENVERRLTREVFLLFFERLTIKQVRALLVKHNLIQYASFGHARKYLTLHDYCFFVKRFVYARALKG